MTTNQRERHARGLQNGRRLAGYGSRVHLEDVKGNARNAIIRWGVAPEPWCQPSRERADQEGPSDYGMPSSSSIENAQQFRNDLSAIRSVLEQIQELMGQYTTVYEQAHGTISGWTSATDDPHLRLGDGGHFVFGTDEDGEPHSVYALTSMDMGIGMGVRGRLSELMEQLVSHLLSLLRSYGSFHSPLALVGGSQNVGIDIEALPAQVHFERRVMEGIQTTKEEFNRLADEWENNRPRGVGLADMAMHPTYQQIIGIGSQAIPWLLERLEKKPLHWFWALNAITRLDDVIPEDCLGNVAKMAEAWLSWGERQGFAK